MAADDTGLTGLWFMGQKYFALYLDREHKEKDLPVFRDTKHWLDIYFPGKNQTLNYRFILREALSKTKFGKFYIPSPTGKR